MIPLVALAAGALQLLSLFGGPPDDLLPGFWELVVLAAGCGLVAYGAVDRVPGAAYLGLANLLAFVPWSRSAPDATLLWWPLLLILLGARRDAGRAAPAQPAPARARSLPRRRAAARRPRGRGDHAPRPRRLPAGLSAARSAAGSAPPTRSRPSAPPSRSSPSSTCSAPICVAGRDRLAQRQLERLLGARVNGTWRPRGRRPALERARAEVRLGAPADLVEVDADRRQRLGVEPAGRARSRSASGVAPCAAEHRAGPAVAARDAEQQLPGADPLALRAPRASSCARSTASRALFVNRSNITAPSARAAAPAAVLLVDRLLADAERPGDLLPRPAALARVVDLQRLERLEQRPQRRHRGQPDLGVLLAVASARSVACVMVVNLH